MTVPPLRSLYRDLAVVEPLSRDGNHRAYTLIISYMFVARKPVSD
jgi:hypothetical protein